MIREGQGPYTQEQYTFGAGPYVHVQTGDQHGTLRLVRKGGTLLGYYRSLADGSWVLAGSRTGDPVFTNDFQVSISSWTDGPTFGHEAVGITLSHFVMTADTVLPGPYGIPSWKMGPAEQQEASLPQLKQLDVSPPPSRRAIRPLESNALPTGILDEDLNLDLNAAIQSYQTLVTQFDAQRPLAANAIFRMAECYRRLGRTDEARPLYARILREFADQVPLVRLSRKHVASLAGPGAGSSPPPQPVFGSRKPAQDLQAPAPLP
ncbi:MAG: tetratricopeptide repeat protein [Limisphaerales bacterium]